MAGTSGLRRAIARDEVEALAVSVHGDRPLPPLYFVIPAGADEEGDRFAVTYLLRVRANGFMVVLPDLARVREYVESLLNDDGDPAALVHRDQIQAETVRGRQLGPAHTLLVDLPWPSCSSRPRPFADCRTGLRESSR